VYVVFIVDCRKDGLIQEKTNSICNQRRQNGWSKKLIYTLKSFPQNMKQITKFDVSKSVHHHTIQINQPTRCNSFTSLLLDVYVWLNMFRSPLRPASRAYNCTRSFWFYRWSVVLRGLADHKPIILQPPRSNGKTRSS